MKLLLVVGIRPNFVKAAPVMAQIKKHPAIKSVLIHTGQHYDFLLSQAFFQDLEIPEPDYHLDVGSGSHGEQTARMLERLEKVFIREQPERVIVFGDANSTLAGALAAAKLHIPVAHVEAGLRSFNSKMPEELNRRLADHCSDLLFVTEHSGMENLRHEGIPEGRVHFVGNVMIDSLLKHIGHLTAPTIGKRRKLNADTYAVLTLHRPENVDDPSIFKPMLKVLAEFAQKLPIVWPIHPRTRTRLKEFGFEALIEPFSVIEPLRYLEMLGLVKHARFVLTDSGGIQEETTMLGVPCLTLRTETERPITVEVGTNTLVGTEPERIREYVGKFFNTKGEPKQGRIPHLWDGKTAERIVQVLMKQT